MADRQGGISRRSWPWRLSRTADRLATRSYDNPQITLWNAGGTHRGTLGRAGDGPTFTADGTREAAGVVTPDLMFSPDGRCLAGAGPRWQTVSVGRGYGQPPLGGASPGRASHRALRLFAQRPHAGKRPDGRNRDLVREPSAAPGVPGSVRADRKNQRVYLAYDYYGKVRLI